MGIRDLALHTGQRMQTKIAQTPIEHLLPVSAQGDASSRIANLDTELHCTPAEILPTGIFDELNEFGKPLTRSGVLAEKKQLGLQRELTFIETKGMKQSIEKNALYKAIRAYKDAEDALEERLNDDFIPQHSPSQFLGPRSFFQSRLFGASNDSIARQINVEFPLASSQGKPFITYRGPELRQSDALVFLAILHMLRDVIVGTKVCLEPQQVCVALFGRYDGNSRRQLREHVQRLQTGLIITDKYTVQLCLGFEHPRFGLWSVALHPHIIELFKLSPEVWFPIPVWLSLRRGLTTWLFTYIQSQTKLIPTNITHILEMCGSKSALDAFTNSLRNALKELARLEIIAPGWSLKNGRIHWMKKSQNQ